MVFEDSATGGCRLHAAVWEGKLRACPVWTAFSMCSFMRSNLNSPCSYSCLYCYCVVPSSTNCDLPLLVPPNVSSSWLLRKSKRRIWLRDIQPYVFWEKYRPTNQRKGRLGAFELAFANSEAATRFQELFASSPDTSAASAAPDPSEQNDRVADAS